MPATLTLESLRLQLTEVRDAIGRIDSIALGYDETIRQLELEQIPFIGVYRQAVEYNLLPDELMVDTAEYDNPLRAWEHLLIDLMWCKANREPFYCEAEYLIGDRVRHIVTLLLPVTGEAGNIDLIYAAFRLVGAPARTRVE